MNCASGRKSFGYRKSIVMLCVFIIDIFCTVCASVINNCHLQFLLCMWFQWMVEWCSRFYCLVFIYVLIDILNVIIATAHTHTHTHFYLWYNLFFLLNRLFGCTRCMLLPNALFFVRSIESNPSKNAVLQPYCRMYYEYLLRDDLVKTKNFRGAVSPSKRFVPAIMDFPVGRMMSWHNAYIDTKRKQNTSNKSINYY